MPSIKSAISKFRCRWRAALSVARAAAADASANPLEAQEHAEVALRLYKEIGDSLHHAEALVQLSASLLHQGKTPESFKAALEALPVLEESGHPLALKVLLKLGEFANTSNAFPSAVVALEKAARLAAQLRYHEDECNAYMHLCAAFLQLGIFDEAEEYANRCIDVAERHSNARGAIAGYDLLAAVRFFRGQRASTMAAIRRAHKIAGWIADRRLQAFELFQIGKYLSMFGDNEAVHREMRDGFAVLEREADPALPQLGAIYSRALAASGDLRRAKTEAQRALDLARQTGENFAIRKALLVLGEIQKSMGNLADAEQNLKEVILLDEDIRISQMDVDRFKVSVGEGFRGEFFLLQQVLAARNKLEDLLEVTEQGRARAFTDLVRSSNESSSGTQPSNISLAEIHAFARKTGATFIEYSFILKFGWHCFLPMDVDTELYIIVVKPGGSVHFVPIQIGPMQTALRVLGTLPGTPDSIALSAIDRNLELPGAASKDADVLSHLETLYEVLIAPVLHLLPDAQESLVVFVPDSFLISTPFAALHDAAGGCLLERFPILVAPSMEVLARIQTRREMRPTSERKALVIGDPDSSLRFARTEAEAIKKMLDEKTIPSTHLIGAQATKQRVLSEMSHFSILHFATHGRIGGTDGSDMPGALLLAPHNGREAWLSSDEVMKLELNADLVVLSACYSGAGRETNDGIIGLSRAFLAAGANAVLVALWKIPDQNTEILMREFYRCYLNDPARDKAKALQAGMLEARKFNANPDSWAAFHLIGERF